MKTLVFKFAPLSLNIKNGHGFPPTKALELVSALLFSRYEHPHQLLMRIRNAEEQYEALRKEAQGLRAQAQALAALGCALSFVDLDCVIIKAQKVAERIAVLNGQYHDSAHLLVQATLEQNWVEKEEDNSRPVQKPGLVQKIIFEDWRPSDHVLSPGKERKQVYRHHIGADTRRPNPAAMRGTKIVEGMAVEAKRPRPLLGGHTGRRREPVIDVTTRAEVRRALRAGEEIPAKKRYAD